MIEHAVLEQVAPRVGEEPEARLDVGTDRRALRTRRAFALAALHFLAHVRVHLLQRYVADALLGHCTILQTPNINCFYVSGPYDAADRRPAAARVRVLGYRRTQRRVEVPPAPGSHALVPGPRRPPSAYGRLRPALRRRNAARARPAAGTRRCAAHRLHRRGERHLPSLVADRRSAPQPPSPLQPARQLRCDRWPAVGRCDLALHRRKVARPDGVLQELLRVVGP